MFVIVGLPDATVKESKDRVLAAIKNSGSLQIPSIVLLTSPGDLRKEGALSDLPIALGLLAPWILSKKHHFLVITLLPEN